KKKELLVAAVHLKVKRARQLLLARLNAEELFENPRLLLLERPLLFLLFRVRLLVPVLFPILPRTRLPDRLQARRETLVQIGGNNIADDLLRAADGAEVGDVLAVIGGFDLAPEKRWRRVRARPAGTDA